MVHVVVMFVPLILPVVVTTVVINEYNGFALFLLSRIINYHSFYYSRYHDYSHFLMLLSNMQMATSLFTTSMATLDNDWSIPE